MHYNVFSGCLYTCISSHPEGNMTCKVVQEYCFREGNSIYVESVSHYLSICSIETVDELFKMTTCRRG